MKKNEDIYQKARDILKQGYGAEAEFRDGQYEAIEAAVTKKRTIVVQKTGWGKSLVYFVAARMLREKGITVVISPLLVLMDNQKAAAERVGLTCRMLNSKVRTREERSEILTCLRNNECDIFFTTPETLYSQDMQRVLPELKIAFFVIDECHCISDWGHDFRLEYGKLNRIIDMLPENVSVLGTTATANDRVIEDLRVQFGENTYVSRGPLTRESLHIQILDLETKAQRYAWLAKNLNKIPGNGIIYCLTVKDCDRLADFLKRHNIAARAYHSGTHLMDTIEETEQLFMQNKLKVLVATIKLGMGYDKSDIGFVIHFQKPSSPVGYYQQIGRAGRKEGVEAYCFLMTGDKDREINEYFIENAFPTEEQEKAVVDALDDAEDGLSTIDLRRRSNISSKALTRCIMFLLNQRIIYQDRDSRRYYRTGNSYRYMGDHYDQIRAEKRAELDMMDDYIRQEGCLSRYIVNALNDRTASDCGKCANCLHRDILDGIELPDRDDLEDVQEYLDGLYVEITPRKHWGAIDNPFDSNSIISRPNETGIALAKYNDAGYGEMVAHDKYRADAFRKELVDKTVQVLRERIGDQGYTIVTNIPSARNRKVAEFAKEVAEGLGYSYQNLLDVTGRGDQQKTMQNTYFQYQNAVSKICVREGAPSLNGENVILIDDLADSRWTLTVAGALLKKEGAGKVYPFCLADSSQSER